MNKCPHCGRDPCLPPWLKLSLGPMSSTRCGECGYRVCIHSSRAWLATLPAVAVIIIIGSGLLENPLPALALLPISLALAVVLYIVWVPLRRADLTTASMVEAGRARIAAERAARAKQAQG